MPMELRELYDLLLAEITENRLMIRNDTAEGIYGRILYAIKEVRLTIARCQVELRQDVLAVRGRCSWKQTEEIFGEANVLLTTRKGGEALLTDMVMSFYREGTMKEYFGNLPSYGRGGLERNAPVPDGCVLIRPVLKWKDKGTFGDDRISLSGFLRFPKDERWSMYSFLTFGNLPVKGEVVYEGWGVYASSVRFTLEVSGFQNIRIPFGQAGLSVVLKTRRSKLFAGRDPFQTDVLLKLSVYLKQIEKKAEFYVDLLSGYSQMNLSAVFPSGITIGDAAAFFGSMFGVEKLYIPKEAAYNTFSLYEIEAFTNDSPKLLSVTNGVSGIRRLMAIFGLTKPWNFPVPGLTVDNLMVGWEISWLEQQKYITSLHIALDARLRFGNYELAVELGGSYPALQLSGRMIFSRQEMMLSDLMGAFSASAPAEWRAEKKKLAEAEVFLCVPNRSYGLTVIVEEVLEFNIGGLTIGLKSVEGKAERSPAGNSFRLSGNIQVGSGENRFTLHLSALYKEGWEFRGGILEGKADIVYLMGELFGIRQLSELAVKLQIDELDVRYDTREESFEVTAAFCLDNFTIFGLETSVGGRVLVRKEAKAQVFGSLLFYMKAGMFRFLVQMNDFYQEKVSYLFRLEWGKVYLQAVYEVQELKDDTHKNKKKAEIVTVSMGGTTLGELMESLIHMMNPNLNYHLPSPWNVLNQISLSRFLLRINVTDSIADFLYKVDKKIPGLMEIDEIGIRYCKEKEKGNEETISFVLTGRLLTETYTAADPLSWDAVHEQPPANTADGEQKLTVYYIGIGRHLDMEAVLAEKDIAEAMAAMKEKIDGEMGAIAYGDTSGWLVGTDFKIHDLFRLQVIFAEPNLYGARVVVEASSKSPLAVLNGLELELMYKKIGADTGMFRGQLLMPEKYRRFTLGVFEIQIGLMVVEIYTNGSFYIDLGFPHGGDFSRSFGIAYSIYTGRGGVYFGVLKGDAVRNVPEALNGNFSPVVLIGVGLCVGLSKGFDFGIVKGGLSVTMTGILEGVFGVFHERGTDREELYYKVSAVVGISGSLFLNVDFKIIVVQANAEVSVFCGLTLEAYRRAKAVVEVKLKVGASIKILFIKIKFSFTFQEKIEFTFGKDENAPWKLKEENRAVLSNRSVPVKQFTQALFHENPLNCRNGSSGSFVGGTKGTGKQNLRLYLMPCFSVKNPGPTAEAEKIHCAAFLLTMEAGEFRKLADMVAELVFQMLPEEALTLEEVLAIDADSFTYEFLETFFENQALFTICHGEAREQETQGVVFPMFPQMCISYGTETEREEIQFSGNPVSTDYMNRLREYFSQLKEGTSETAKARGSETLAFCAALMEDWFGMLLRGILHKITVCFEALTVVSDNLTDVHRQYGVPIEKLLRDNQELKIAFETLPRHTYRIQEGDTLRGICDRAGLDLTEFVRHLWEDVNLLNPEAFISADGFYEEFLAQGEGISREIREEYAQNGVIRVAPDRCLRELYERLFPGGNREEAEQFFAGQKILKPLYSVVQNEAHLSYQGSAAQAILSGVCTWEELCLAVTEGFVHMEPQQVLVRGSREVPAEKAREIAGGAYDEIGAELSRFFLQGLRIPSFRKEGTEETYPLYELSGQQQILKDAEQDFYIRMSREEGCSYIEIENTETAEAGTDNKEMKNPQPEGALIVIPAEELKKRLPSGEVLKIQSMEEIPDFLRVPETVSLVQKISYIGREEQGVLFPVSGEVQKKIQESEEPELAGADKIRWGSFFTVKVKRYENPGSCVVLGVEANERQQLGQVLGTEVAGISVFLHSPLLEPEEYWKEADWKNGVLLKGNLSVETHMEPVLRSANNLEMSYSAMLTEPKEFLRMLWECSTVGGGGYYLYSGKEGAGDIEYDEKGYASVYVWAQYVRFADSGGFVNGILCGQQAEEITLTWRDRWSYVPSLPPGYKGFTFSLGERKAGEDFRAENLADLFQNTGYRIAEGTLSGSGDSAPVFPQQTEEGILKYRMGIPLYRFAKEETISVYGAVNKTAEILLEARDILGNRAGLGTYQLTGSYNDELTAFHELPETVLKYTISRKRQKPTLLISICQPADLGDVTEEKLAYVRQAEVQYACEDMGAYVTCSLFPEERLELFAEDMEKLVSYPKEWYQFAEKKVLEPASVELELSLDEEVSVPFQKEIYKLTVGLVLYRKNVTGENPKAARRESLVLPDTGEGKELSDSRFFTEFEEAYPQLCLAISSAGEGFYVLSTGEKGYLSGAVIKPFEEGNRKLCRYFAKKPLSRVPLSGLVQVGEKEYSYIQIDLEHWLERFLNDMEEALRPEVGGRAARCCRESWERLVRSKGSLAEALAFRYCSLQDGSRLETLESLLADRFRRSLTAYYETDIAAVYQAEMRTPEFCRLAVQASGPEGMQIQASKLSSRSGVFCLFVKQKGNKKHYPASVQAVPGELEYHIEVQRDGYEASDWLKPVRPLKNIDFQLASDVGIPNPRIHFPRNPEEIAQTGEAEANIETLLKWNYRGQCVCEGYEQNIVSVRAVFQKRFRSLRESGRGLFEILAEYDVWREALQNEQSASEDQRFTESLEKQAEFAEEIGRCLHEPENLYAAERKAAAEEFWEVEMKLTFLIEEEKVSVQMALSEEAIEQLAELGVTPADAKVKALQEDKRVLVEWGLDGLPLYEYGLVTSYVCISQNETILWDEREGRALPVCPEFIYHSQEVGSAELSVGIEHAQALYAGKAETEEEMAYSLWEILGLDCPEVALDMEIAYVHMLAGLPIEVPAVMIPEAAEGGKEAFVRNISASIRDWQEEKGVSGTGHQWWVDVTIRRKRDDGLLLHVKLKYET